MVNSSASSHGVPVHHRGSMMSSSGCRSGRSRIVIEPRWWTGTPWLDADAYTIDCTDYAMDHHSLREDSDLAVHMRETYERARREASGALSPTCR